MKIPKIKPHIVLRDGVYITTLAGEHIFCDVTLESAYVSAELVWRHQ